MRGRFHYFGKVAYDPERKPARVLWVDQIVGLLDGSIPRGNRGGLTVRDLRTHYLAAKNSDS